MAKCDKQLEAIDGQMNLEIDNLYDVHILKSHPFTGLTKEGIDTLQCYRITGASWTAKRIHGVA